MLRNQKFPGEGDGSNVDVTTTKANQSGGTSHRAEWHAGNAHRGVAGPASIQDAVDDDQQPLHVQEVHLSPHSGNVLDVIDHDHQPARPALPSPQPQKKSKLLPAVGGGARGAATSHDSTSDAASVSTKGKVGQAYKK